MQLFHFAMAIAVLFAFIAVYEHFRTNKLVKDGNDFLSDVRADVRSKAMKSKS